jgi:opacity protein-like surface antigen
MLRRSTLPLVALLALALAPAAVRADVVSIGLEAYGGYNKYDSLGLKNAASSFSLSNKALLKDANTHLGLMGTFKLTSWELGALLELGQNGSSTATTTVGGLIGPAFDLGGLRLEILGELGGRRYGNFLDDAKVVTRGASEAWLFYLGARPGLSMHFGTGLKFVVGVWVFGRWDVTKKNVPVTVTPSGGGPPVSASYDLGGSTYGASLRLGVML